MTVTATTRQGVLIDFIAVERWLTGDDALTLTDHERHTAIHAAHEAGDSIHQIARRLRMAEKTVKAQLQQPPPARYVPTGPYARRVA